MQSVPYAHARTAHLALFRDVANAAALRRRIVAAATMPGDEGDAERARLNFAFIDARLITSVLHVQTAIYAALLADERAALRTKTVHSEILFALNPSSNITEAIRRYGVGDATKTLLVVHIAGDEVRAEEVETQMRAAVQGEMVGLEGLQEGTDWAAVKKYHKLGADRALKDAGGDIERERRVVDNIVTSMVAMKSVAQ